MKNYVFTFIFLASFACAFAQSKESRMQQIQYQLESLKQDNPGLSEIVELSVNRVSIQEFLRAIAINNKLNINVDPNLNLEVVNNFSSVSVAEMLTFLAKKYDLDYEFIGNIISVSKYISTPFAQIKDSALVNFQKEKELVSMDFKSIELSEVCKLIADASNINIILSPGLENKKVSAYLVNLKFENAISNFAYSNELVSEKKGENVYLLKSKSQAEQESRLTEKPFSSIESSQLNQSPIKGLSLGFNGKSDINIVAENVPLESIIKTIAYELGINYYLQSKIDGLGSIKLEHTTFDELLTKLFSSSKYTYSLSNNIYIIGGRSDEGLRKTVVYPLQHRTVEKITTHIPTALSKDIEIKEFNDLNSLVLSGSAPIIDELSMFIKQIDQIVPVVAIEVIIVDYSKTRTIRTGLTAGLGSEPKTSGGVFLPSTGYGMSAGSVNSLLRDLDFGSSVNLGQVTPNFYLELDALEADGLVNIRSTPKLATLNGTEATLSIGTTEYYVQQTNNIIGTQNPQTVFTKNYQSVNADLSVSIKPFVSGDNQITLEITVNQSDFTDRIEPDAPPNSVTRSFSSMLRVKNQEMILLGGLEQKSNTKNSSGLPLLARVPVLKWFFARQLRERQNSKLNILIKPTVIY